MNIPAGIASSTNSFSVSFGRGSRLSANGSTSDPTGVLGAPDDHSSTSQDSGASEGSPFHSVLQQFSSSQQNDGDAASDTANTTAGTASQRNTSAGSRADGTQSRNT